MHALFNETFSLKVRLYNYKKENMKSCYTLSVS